MEYLRGCEDLLHSVNVKKPETALLGTSVGRWGPQVYLSGEQHAVWRSATHTVAQVSVTS